MHRHTLSDTGDMPSTRSSRAPSFSSDRPSVASSVTFQMPSTVRPAPAYVAASVASQMVTDHHNAQLRHEDDYIDDLENAIFSGQALALINAFLDHLLFAFLSSARSSSLTAIRPAISDVLKPRLAHEAMEAADEELQGLLAGEDDEELPAADSLAADKWDVEKVWKRTRLRIMVYTRLGELEDEDEDKYVQQERGLSMDVDEDDEAGLVSWASAIFLTSVIEYIAEQTLLVAGSAAFARLAAKIKKQAQQTPDHVDNFERIVIEEPDVEKIALNSALGRLWRTWRKRVRSPISPLSPGRGIRPVSSYSSFHNRKASRDTIDESIRGDRGLVPEHTPTETEIAANIPLPIGDNDVNEIEVPGLAKTFEEDAESSGTQTPVARPQRPASVILLSGPETFRRRTTAERPVSMPMPPAGAFSVPTKQPLDEPETPFETPMERFHEQESYLDDEDDNDAQIQPPPQKKQRFVEEKHGDESPDADADMLAFAAATGLGFRMSTVGPLKTEELEHSEDEAEIPSAGGYESEPKVLQSKRISIEKSAPGVVRTFSTRSSSVKSAKLTPVTTPRAASQAEARSYLDDTPSDDEADGHQAIGIARTSDIPIRSTPTPPVDTPADWGKGPAQGGYVELKPRQAAPTSAPFRSSPTLDSRPIVPDRSVARKEVHTRSTSGHHEPTSNPIQYANTANPSRRQESMPPKLRGTSLPSLQEVETAPSKASERVTPEGASQYSGPVHSSPKRNPLYSSRDVPVHIAERQVLRTPTEDPVRSRSGTHERSPSDKDSLKRGTSSSSSAKKSATFGATSSGRESELSHRSRNLSGRMSEEDREREFDTLVKGEETVKYTLTPQNMRELDVSSSRSHLTNMLT